MIPCHLGLVWFPAEVDTQGKDVGTFSLLGSEESAGREREVKEST